MSLFKGCSSLRLGAIKNVMNCILNANFAHTMQYFENI